MSTIGPGPTHAYSITPNDSAALPQPVNWLGFATALTGAPSMGTVVIDTPGGEKSVTVALSSGGVYPISATKVWSTGTSAGATIVGFYGPP